MTIAAAKSVQLSSDVWLAAAGLMAILILGAILITWVSRWHRRQNQEVFSPHDQLVTFRLLYERGELSQDEYQRIRQRLLPQLKEPKVLPGEKSAETDPPADPAVRRTPTDKPPESAPSMNDSPNPPSN